MYQSNTLLHVFKTLIIEDEGIEILKSHGYTETATKSERTDYTIWTFALTGFLGICEDLNGLVFLRIFSLPTWFSFFLASLG
jgi:hypothetical protein